MNDFLKNDASIRAAIGAYSMVNRRRTDHLIHPADVVALLEGLLIWCGRNPVDFDAALVAARFRLPYGGDADE